MVGQEVISYRGHEISPAYDPGKWVAAKVDGDCRRYLGSPVTGRETEYDSPADAKRDIDSRLGK